MAARDAARLEGVTSDLLRVCPRCATLNGPHALICSQEGCGSRLVLYSTAYGRASDHREAT